MMQSGSRMDRIAKIVAMGVGSYLVWYFAGPMTGELGRHAFEGYYYLLHGTPTVYSFEYWLNYLPLRGHTTYYSYKYGDMLCAALSAPFFYKVPDLLRYCLKRPQTQQDPDEAVLNESMDGLANLSHLSELLENSPAPMRRSISFEDRPQLLVSSVDANDSVPLNAELSQQSRSSSSRMHVTM